MVTEQSFPRDENGTPLSRELFLRPTLEVAKLLLGMKLVSEIRGVRASGMIVEVEAYGGSGITDPACHAHTHRTKRNEVMFWEGGHAYVYFIYGMHFCVNVVTEQKDIGAAVLLRALQPLEGISAMKRRRKIAAETQLTNGPGKLCQALAITRTLVGEDLISSNRIWLEPYCSVSPESIVSTTRIGISKAAHYPWRFYLRDNRWVSR